MSMSRNISIRASIDWMTVFIFVLLLIFGWLNIYGASYNYEQTSIFDFSYRSGKQFLWMGVSVVIASVILLMDYKVFTTFSVLFYIITVVVLLLTAFVAPDIKGSRSWIPLGPVSLQPAEFAKIFTALMLAKVMSEYNFRLKGFRNYAKVCVVILVPMIAIILEKEMGSALVFLAFSLMLYREGLPGLVPLLGFLCVLLFVLVIRFDAVQINTLPNNSVGMLICLCIILLVTWFLMYHYTREKKDKRLKYHILPALGIGIVVGVLNIWVEVPFVYVALGVLAATIVYLLVRAFLLRSKSYMWVAVFIMVAIVYTYSAEYLFKKVLQDHQRNRIEVVLGIKDDPSGAGYNINQAKIAIGSGGFLGKGFLKGTQTKLKYVPEQDTDFIFCTVGEEFGFWGSVLLIGLYVWLLLRLIFLAERQNDTFARIYGYCVVSIFFAHVMINIGMVLGLVLVIGIPLPFMSYGGSSLCAFTVLLFIFLKLDIARLGRAT